MTDEARIQRLTELARRVWRDRGAFVSWDAFYDTAKVVNDRGTILAKIVSPQALDALEAALLVLAGDPLFYKRNYEQAEEECTLERERAEAAERRLAEVEKLAAELRERAKGEP